MPLNINWQQILLHLLNFAVLFAILYFLLYKPVKDFMDKRTQHYRELDEQAADKLAEAEQTKAEYDARLAEADKEIAARKKAAYVEMEEAAAARLQAAENEAAQLMDRTHAALEKDRQNMLQQAQAEVMGMVTDAAEKLIIQSSTSRSFDDFLDAAEEENGEA